LEKEDGGIKEPRHRMLSNMKIVAAAMVPVALLAAMILFIFGTGTGQDFLNAGTPLPEVTIERIEFHDSEIIAFIQNTGPIEITIAQADVNDRIHPAAIEPSKELARLAQARVVIPFPWNAGEPYEVGITTSDGTRFSKSVTAAILTPTPSLGQAAFFALIGTYVGVIPVLIGLLWSPFIRRLGNNSYRFFLSLTVGLLVFLGIDALIESNGIALDNIAGTFNSQILIIMVAIFSFMILQFGSSRLAERAQSRAAQESEPSGFAAQQQRQLVRPAAIALMIAVGIGLHNFGEGLAIGAATVLGEMALGTFLIIGFTLHNTTEGLAIVAPLARMASRKSLVRKLLLLGLIAGGPTIVGTWIGGFVYSPIAAVIFLSIGAGAIFQVVYSIYSWMAKSEKVGAKMLSDMPFISGFAIGMLIMYITGILVAS
jgi:zinc transporter, ZIP family